MSRPESPLATLHCTGSAIVAVQKGVSRSVQVLLNGTEAVMILTCINSMVQRAEGLFACSAVVQFPASTCPKTALHMQLSKGPSTKRILHVEICFGWERNLRRCIGLLVVTLKERKLRISSRKE